MQAPFRVKSALIPASSGAASRISWRLPTIFAALLTALPIIPQQAASGSSPALTILRSFKGGTADGQWPATSLTLGADGNFYGTTQYGGGGSSGGTFFKMSPSGTTTILHFFGDGSVADDGIYSTAGVIQTSDGNFYGTTSGGGANQAGTVFKMTPSGVETILHAFSFTGPDGNIPDAGLVKATDGNFYGTTIEGPALGFGTVFRMTSSGALTTMYSFDKTATDGVLPEANLIQASDGDFYGTTAGGGTYNNIPAIGNGTIFKMTRFGAVTILHRFRDGSNANDGIYPTCALLQASDGNFYGTTQNGGANNAGTVFKMTPAGVVTILHSFANGSVADDGVLPYAGLIEGPDGNLYGTTYGGGVPSSGLGTIFKITKAGSETILHKFHDGSVLGDGEHPYSAVTLGPDGNLYGTTHDGGASANGTIFRLAVGLFPPAPAIVTATAADGHVVVKWSVSPGATSYNVYRGTSPGGESTIPLTTGVTTTSFVDTTVTNNVTYYYKLKALNATGIGYFSPEASAKPEPAVPPAPKALTAVAGNAQVSLSWTASTGAVSYNVYRGTHAAGEGTTPLATGLTATAYVDHGVTNGAGYYYVVVAVNTGGTSPKSNEAGAKPQAVAPPAPANLTATAGNGQITLSWSPVSGVNGYKLYRGTAPGGESATALYGATSGTTTYINTGLTNGKTYYYTVEAVNTAGLSPASNEASATPAP